MKHNNTTPCHYGNKPTTRTNASHTSDNSETKHIRRQKHYLKNQIQKAIGGRWHRSCTCGIKAVASVISVRRNNKGNLSMNGVETCHNVWTCPICVGKISSQRRNEIDTAIKRHWDTGGRVYMFALTAPHYHGQGLRTVKKRITGQWGKLIQSASFKRLKLKYGIDGYIRALEITYSNKNGWHPHLHILLFTNNEISEEQRQSLEWAIFERWAELIRKDKGGECERSIFKLELCTHPEQAGDYVGKWGAGSEMTGFHSKIAKGGGFSPWALLDVIGKGGKWARAVFAEYVQTMHGTRQLVWSRGLKTKYDIQDLTDEETLANEDMGQDLVQFKNSALKRNYKKHGFMWVVRLYESVENGTFRDFANKYGITGEILSEIPRAIPKPDKRTPEMQHRLDRLRDKMESKTFYDALSELKEKQNIERQRRIDELNQSLFENERIWSKVRENINKYM